MNVIYILYLVVILITLFIGNLFKTNPDLIIKHSDELNKNIACSGDFAAYFLNQNKIDNIDVAKMDVKHTDCYTSKFKAIKLSSKIYDSNSLTSLCFSSKLANDAVKDSKSPLLFKLIIAVNFLSNIISIALVPALLLFAIISTFLGLASIAYWILLSLLIAHTVLLIYRLMLHLIQSKQQKNILNVFEQSNMFDKSELNSIETILIINLRQKFSDYCYSLFKFLKLISPAIIFEKQKR